jgi:ribA/ribD-fused uncharacterized protein
MTEERFTLFWHGPFSQWAPSPFQVGGLSFTHAEQFMMHGKAVLFGDRVRAAAILSATTPKEMKALGRAVERFDPEVWKLFREGIVYTGSYAKYAQNADLCATLLATRGTTLVEASPYDKVWGIGLAEHDPRSRDRSQWQGLNLLGQVLTRVREAIAFEQGVNVRAMQGTPD